MEMTLKTKRNLYLLFLLLITLILTFSLAYGLYYLYRLNFYFKIIYYFLVVFSYFIIFTKSYKTPTKIWLIILCSIIKFIGVAFVFLDAFKGLFYRKNKTSFTKLKVKPNLKSKNNIYQEVGLYVDYLTNYGEYDIESVKVFTDGIELFEEILKKIDSAKSYVFLGAYIIKHGKRLNELLSSLYKALERGVEVYLFADYFGSGNIFKTQEFLALKEKGAKLFTFNKPKFFLSLNDNLRYHQKSIVIDGKYSFISSVNIADNLIDNEKDLGVIIKGRLALAVLKSFFEIFNLSNYEKYAVSQKEGTRSGIYCSGQGDKTFETIIYSAFFRAKKDIKIISPYLSFSKERLEFLERLIKRQVKITLIAPKSLKEKARNFITDESLIRLLEIGVEIFEYDKKFLHSKLIIIDDETCFLGSVNFDERSLCYAVENTFVSCDNEVIAPLLDYFLDCKDNSKQKNINKKPFSFFGIRKIMARILSPLV